MDKQRTPTEPPEIITDETYLKVDMDKFQQRYGIYKLMEFVDEYFARTRKQTS